MTALNWISPTTMQSLGWTLVHFVWQGTALAALAAAAMALCRRASARYVVGVAALGLMLAAPVGTFLLLQRAAAPDAHSAAAWSWAGGRNFAAVRASARRLSRAPSGANNAPSKVAPKVAPNVAPNDPPNVPVPVPEAFPRLVEAWLIGVAFFSLRTAGGFVLLERQQRRLSVPVSDAVLEICIALQHRLGLTRVIRFCECQWLQAPAVIGWLRPVVLLPITTLTGLSEEQLRSVIAHELAHIRRLDAFVNVFQVGVETLLFYHPAVWWLNMRIRGEREHCCDDVAIGLCGNAIEYARALTLMEEWRSAPAFAMAANRGPLTERVMRVLGLKPVRSTAGRAGLTASVLCLGAALIAGNALVSIAYPKPTAYASDERDQRLSAREAAAALRGQPAARAAAAQASAQASAQAQASARARVAAGAQAVVVAQAAATPGAKATPATPAPAAERGDRATPAQSYIDGLKAAGLSNLDVDEVIELKIQGVTPQYVLEMKEAGVHPEVDSLVAMKVQGITPIYVKELRSLGFTADDEELIALKVQGVNADYVKQMKDAGIKVDADELVALKVQGVTPIYIRDIRAAGLTVDCDDVIALKVQGVTPEYVHGLQELGLRPSTDDVVAMKVQGVTPEYLRDIRALGLNPSADEIVGMKVQGVTPEFIKALQAAGFKPSVDEVIGAKVQGITPEFIERARKHGFENLTIEKLIELKVMGVFETKGEL